MAQAHQGAGEMGHHQPDKADDAGQGDQRGGGERRKREDDEAQARHIDPERMGRFLAGQKRVQPVAAGQAGSERQRGAEEPQRQIAPAGEPQAARRPEQNGIGRALVSGKDEPGGERAEEEGDGKARDHQPLGRLAALARQKRQNRGGREKRAGKGGDRQRPDAEPIPEQGDDRDRPRRRARRQAEQERVGQIVAGRRLKQRPDHRQTRADADRQKHARQAQVENDARHRPRRLGAQPDRAGERARHVSQRQRRRAIGDAGERQGEEERRPDAPEADDPARHFAGKRAGCSALASASTASILAGPGVICS